MTSPLDALIPDLPLLTIARVAELLAVSDDTVYRMVGRGELRSYDVAGVIRVYPPSVREYLCRHARHVPQSGPQPGPEALTKPAVTESQGL